MTKEEWMAMYDISNDYIRNLIISMEYDFIKKCKESMKNAQTISKVKSCEDCVSREAVMQTLYDCGCEIEIQDTISKLPPVAPKSTECEDAIDRQALRARFNHLDEVYEGMSEEEKHEAYIYGQIIRAIDDASPVTPKQKTLEWIPVKDPYTELPKKDMLWVTKDDCGCRWVDTVYYDMTEWSDSIHDVVAYALYDEPEPYKEGVSE